MSASRIFNTAEINLNLDNLTRTTPGFIRSGVSGMVFKATYLGKPVALKVMTGQNAREDGKNEIAAMGPLTDSNTPHIVKLIAHLQLADKFCIMMALYENACYESKFIKNQQSYISINARLIIMEDMVKALAYLHDFFIIHCDIKPANILLDKHLRAYLGDLGCSVKSDDFCNHLPFGTPLYSPPELLDVQTEKYLDGHPEKREFQSFLPQNSYSSDVYSLGATMWSVFHRKEFMAHSSSISMLRWELNQGNRGGFDTECPLFFQKLISESWKTDPFERSTAKEMLNQIQNANISELVVSI